jgi:hypothetical protein
MLQDVTQALYLDGFFRSTKSWKMVMTFGTGENQIIENSSERLPGMLIEA